MINMVQVFVLVNCELGFEDEVISKLKKIDGVKNIQETLGSYEILARIKSDRMKKLREITSRIDKINEIRSIITLIEH